MTPGRVRLRRASRLGRALATAVLVLGPAPLRAQNAVVAEIPFDDMHNRVVVPVTIGTSGPFRLILDTGMPYDGILLFDPARVDMRAFDRLAQAAVGGAGGGAASQALTDEAAAFSVGTQRFEDQRVIMLTGGALRGFPTDGVIGYTLLGHYAVEVDHDRGVLILYEAGSFTPGDGWVSLDLRFRENRIPWMEVSLVTAREAPVRLEAYVDLASPENLELLERAANRFTLPAELRERHSGRGLSGDVRGREGRVSSVTLGPWVLRDLAVIVTPAAVRSRQAGADAIVSAGLLRRFNVVFDYAHERLHLRPNRAFATPF